MFYPLVCVITVGTSTWTGRVAGMGGARLGKQFWSKTLKGVYHVDDLDVRGE